MKSILLFGAGKIADVVFHFMAEKSGWPIIGFVVEDAYRENAPKQFNQKPVLSYSEAKERFAPEMVDYFVALGYHSVNRERGRIITMLKNDGYSLISYVDSESGVPTDLVYGENTFIMPQALIHPRVTLGDDNFIWSGAMIGHHSKIGSHNWFTSGVQIGGNVTIGDYNFLGMLATISHGVTIGNENFFGAHTLITKSIENQTVSIQESTKAFRLTTDQFLRFSNFGSL